MVLVAKSLNAPIKVIFPMDFLENGKPPPTLLPPFQCCPQEYQQRSYTFSTTLFYREVDFVFGRPWSKELCHAGTRRHCIARCFHCTTPALRCQVISGIRLCLEIQRIQFRFYSCKTFADPISLLRNFCVSMRSVVYLFSVITSVFFHHQFGKREQGVLLLWLRSLHHRTCHDHRYSHHLQCCPGTTQESIKINSTLCITFLKHAKHSGLSS